jgi:methionine-gamma-lyase
MPSQKFRPESLMMSFGYEPKWSEGAIKCPIFQTSTFVFPTAEEGKAHFELAYGLREPREGEQPGLIYSRLNNPDLEILENRLCLWDQAEEGAVFESGMSAISTALFTFLKPGDVLLYSNPLYGGTSHFITEVLVGFGVKIVPFMPGESADVIRQRLQAEGLEDRLSVIYIETPANPTNIQIDISAMCKLREDCASDNQRAIVMVDNTYMGPLWQHPLELGADLLLYSATKYIGGHSDVIAGACLGSHSLITQVKGLRTFLGSMAGPWTGWLLMRSLETLKVRMDEQVRNAQQIANYLNGHSMVEKVYYLGLLQPADGEQYEIYQRQCKAPGAMVSFDIKGGEKAAFKFMNSLKLIKLAVSLGSTESLVQHPASMTHAGVPAEVKSALNITDQLVRLSIGVENVHDLIYDLNLALEAAGKVSGSRVHSSV